MTEQEEKVTRIQKSLEKLVQMRMNIPPILCNLDSPISEEQRVNNKMTVKAIAERFKMIKAPSVIIPGLEEYAYMNKEKFLVFADSYGGEAIVIFKAPKSFPLVTGVCEPSPYYNKVRLNDSQVYNVIWGDSVLRDFPTILKRPVTDLNGMLQRGRSELDGMPIRFTFHPQGEGFNSDRIVLWGMNYA